MQPQRNCEHTVSGAAGWYCSGQTVRPLPALAARIRPSCFGGDPPSTPPPCVGVPCIVGGGPGRVPCVVCYYSRYHSTYYSGIPNDINSTPQLKSR